MDRWNYAAILVGVFLAILAFAVVMMLTPGHYVYVPETAPAPIATPMDVTFKMRGPNGEIQEIWLCKYDRKDGWICQPVEESDGETLDK